MRKELRKCAGRHHEKAIGVRAYESSCVSALLATSKFLTMLIYTDHVKLSAHKKDQNIRKHNDMKISMPSSRKGVVKSFQKVRSDFYILPRTRKHII